MKAISGFFILITFTVISCLQTRKINISEEDKEAIETFRKPVEIVSIISPMGASKNSLDSTRFKSYQELVSTIQKECAIFYPSGNTRFIWAITPQKDIIIINYNDKNEITVSSFTLNKDITNEDELILTCLKFEEYASKKHFLEMYLKYRASGELDSTITTMGSGKNGQFKFDNIQYEEKLTVQQIQKRFTN